MSELLQVKKLIKYFPVRKGWFGRKTQFVHAVDDISFSLASNETLGLVGESGCGKSTVGFCLLRLIEPTSGEVWFDGHNLLEMAADELRQLRREIQFVFQDPFGSLNPRMTVEHIIEEPLLNHEHLSKRKRREKIVGSLEMVGLPPDYMHRFPHEFSGGQRQRICLARALVLRPKVIVGDESVSALDVSVQAQVLNLMVRLQRELGLSYIFISHDLSVIRYISQRVAVMYLGKIMETAPVRDLYAQPYHPYTQALLAAVPRPNPHRKHKPRIIVGDVPSPIDPPSGCRFHPRCPEKMSICSEKMPNFTAMSAGHEVACHLYTKQAELQI
jgi:oligopeptide transport system ATP-binding protein